MRTDELLLRVECYVAVRKALGYAVRSEEKLLKDFIQFLELNQASSPIRAQTAIEWACAPAPGRGPSGEASRLKVVRRFLSHLQVFEFETEVPGPGVKHRNTFYTFCRCHRDSVRFDQVWVPATGLSSG